MSDTLTVRELIARRIEEEAARLAREHETRLDWADRLSLRVAPPPALDVAEATARACQAFLRDDLRVLVGDRKAGSLDEEIPVAHVPDVTVVATVPLIGG